MRLKKLLSLLLVVAMIATTVILNTIAVVPGQIRYSRKVNGEMYYGDNHLIEVGKTATLSVDDITFNGETANPDDVSYQWTRRQAQNGFVEISNATEASYTVDYENATDYSCSITVNNTSTSIEFYLKKDTLTVAATAEPKGELDEDEFFQIYDIKLGDTVSLTANAVSTLQGATITYKWSRIVVGTKQMWEDLSTTTSTHTFQKTEGTELFQCLVNDGNVTKNIYFSVNNIDTLNVTPVINEFKPNRFERGYMYVGKPGEKVTMSVNAVSTNPEITYSWEKFEFNGQGYVFTPVGNTDSITVTKQEDSYEGNGMEMYECYIKDGNEIINVSFVLFTVISEQVSTLITTADNVPEISINNGVEELSNDLLKDNLQDLSVGVGAEIKLTAEEQKTPSTDEKEAIEKELPENSQVGMYLDINLYKKLEGEQEDTQITETQKEINMSVELPDELLNEDSTQNRTYQVVRMHDGVAKTLDATYDQETNQLTFGTDKFSTYAITYTDKKVIESNSNSQTTNTSNSTDRDNIKSPQTGDNGNFALYLLLLTFGIVSIISYKKLKLN